MLHRHLAQANGIWHRHFKLMHFYVYNVYDITPITEVLSISENAMEIGKTYNFPIHIVLRLMLAGAYGRNTVAV